MRNLTPRRPGATQCRRARIVLMLGHVVAMGGGGFLAGDPSSPLDDLLVALAPRRRPRTVFLATAAGDSERAIDAFHEAFARRDCEPEHVTLFGIPDRPAERVAAADVIVVSGGNTANLLALWRIHEIDGALRHAWEHGAALGGVSAGANCWFEACVTDSFSVELDGLRDGLGFLAGSYCPHFDGEEHRRPVYERLVTGDFPAGIACDDGAAAVYRGTELVEIVADRPEARGYGVSVSGVEPIATRLLR
jgi:dipeptidase E